MQFTYIQELMFSSRLIDTDIFGETATNINFGENKCNVFEPFINNVYINVKLNIVLTKF